MNREDLRARMRRIEKLVAGLGSEGSLCKSIHVKDRAIAVFPQIQFLGKSGYELFKSSDAGAHAREIHQLHSYSVEVQDSSS